MCDGTESLERVALLGVGKERHRGIATARESLRRQRSHTYRVLRSLEQSQRLLFPKIPRVYIPSIDAS